MVLYRIMYCKLFIVIRFYWSKMPHACSKCLGVTLNVAAQAAALLSHCKTGLFAIEFFSSAPLLLFSRGRNKDLLEKYAESDHLIGRGIFEVLSLRRGVRETHHFSRIPPLLVDQNTVLGHFIPGLTFLCQ